MIVYGINILVMANLTLTLEQSNQEVEELKSTLEQVEGEKNQLNRQNEELSKRM